MYDADGGLLGEASYVWGKLRGTRHCGLCDITHSPVRRKPTWDRFVAELGLPFELLHLNEMPTDVASVVATAGAPVVQSEYADGVRSAKCSSVRQPGTYESVIDKPKPNSDPNALDPEVAQLASPSPDRGTRLSVVVLVVAFVTAGGEKNLAGVTLILAAVIAVPLLAAFGLWIIALRSRSLTWAIVAVVLSVAVATLGVLAF
jgi:hypothetical protein